MCLRVCLSVWLAVERELSPEISLSLQVFRSPNILSSQPFSHSHPLGVWFVCLFCCCFVVVVVVFFPFLLVRWAKQHVTWKVW
jgi:hypothetical protein